jgi:hypothetical protein
VSRTVADEAIVLKTYNIGEADRFCVLLTKRSGRIAARAAGVRRTTSKRGAALLPLRRVTMEYAAGRTGTYSITQASCLDAYSHCATSLRAFSCAEQGVEILLNLIHDGEPVEHVYMLAQEFLSLCHEDHPSALLPCFTLKLLSLLGSLPGGEDIAALPRDTSATRRLSPALRTLLTGIAELPLAAAAQYPAALVSELEGFSRYLLGSQLGSSLKSPPVASRLSPDSTPMR